MGGEKGEEKQEKCGAERDMETLVVIQKEKIKEERISEGRV